MGIGAPMIREDLDAPTADQGEPGRQSARARAGYAFVSATDRRRVPMPPRRASGSRRRGQATSRLPIRGGPYSPAPSSGRPRACSGAAQLQGRSSRRRLPLTASSRSPISPSSPFVLRKQGRGGGYIDAPRALILPQLSQLSHRRLRHPGVVGGATFHVPVPALPARDGALPALPSSPSSPKRAPEPLGSPPTSSPKLSQLSQLSQTRRHPALLSELPSLKELFFSSPTTFFSLDPPKIF